MRFKEKRIVIVIGHYGSGKTEFCCNYAIEYAKEVGGKILLSDLDIVNPYFRSRERANYLEQNGVTVMSSLFGNDTNIDLPAISAALNIPLSDGLTKTVLDVGGDKIGARVLRQYNDNIDDEVCDMFAVVNANRPETANLEGAINHIEGIEFEAQRKVTGLINNTHMLRETSVEDVLRGQKLLEEVSEKLNIPIVYVSVVRRLVEELQREIKVPIIPIDMIMRDDWM